MSTHCSYSSYCFLLDDVTIKFKSEHSFAYNEKTGSTPIVVHGNGPIKVYSSLLMHVFDEYANYA